MKRFSNILLYAGMEQNDAALNRAVKLAIENDARLTLMDVVKPIPHALGMLTDTASSKELQHLVSQDHREKLLKIASDFLDTGITIEIVVAEGDTAIEVVRQVMSGDHDLVIKTVNGASKAGKLFGSVAQSLLRVCPCPLWLLKSETHGDFGRVLAAIDLDAADDMHRKLNHDILELGFSVAQREEAEIHIVSAWSLWMDQALRRRSGDAEVDAALASQQVKVQLALDELLQARGADATEFHTHLIRGNPANVVRSVAEQVEADLLVMGTVCRTGAAGFLIGNTAETVLSDVNCSILALKPDGFISPVLPADQAG